MRFEGVRGDFCEGDEARRREHVDFMMLSGEDCGNLTGGEA